MQHFVIDISKEIEELDFFNASTLVVAITSKSVSDFKNLCHIIDASSIEKVIFISSTSVYKEENKEVTETSNLADNELVAIEKEFQQLKKYKLHHFTFCWFAWLQ
ncbi:MAG: hypothetical protein HC798_02300 [Polaribacter sp.]|nr:hypothetical protein [Polaribacter sp.]